jgi:hypothetical protein
VGMGYIDANELLTIGECYFTSSKQGTSRHMSDEKKLKLKDVDPIVVSEVLTDLTALAAKGKS